MFLLSFDFVTLSFATCSVDYLKSYILTKESELNMRVVDPIDMSNCEIKGMMWYCKHMDDLLIRKEVYSIDHDGVGKCSGVLIILRLYPGSEVLGFEINVAMFVKVINNLIFN